MWFGVQGKDAQGQRGGGASEASLCVSPLGVSFMVTAAQEKVADPTAMFSAGSEKLLAAVVALLAEGEQEKDIALEFLLHDQDGSGREISSLQQDQNRPRKLQPSTF